MTPRFFVVHEGAWSAGLSLTLPLGVARHVQVLRLQPGDALVLFDGQGGEWLAAVELMGRKEVLVRLLEQAWPSRELHWQVTLAVGMPANDRMDSLVEKATELGVWAIQPLVCQRSVLRLDGDRAVRKVAHWQGVAQAAAEQSGRTHVPTILPVTPLKAWLQSRPALTHRAVLSFSPTHSVQHWLQSLHQAPVAAGDEHHPAPSPGTDTVQRPHLGFLSGPEGGLTGDEEAQARTDGWVPAGLGPRVLRADTAPLMALALVAGAELNAG